VLFIAVSRSQIVGANWMSNTVWLRLAAMSNKQGQESKRKKIRDF
jgi:hypothetical protein